jgi:hypothetical protein
MNTPHFDAEDWSGVLAQISRALETALAETVAREQALAADNQETALPAALADSEERAGRLRQFADAARERQAQQEETLGGEEEGLRRWLAEALAARQRLAEWASRSLG